VIVHLEPRREGLTLRERALAVALAEPLVLEAHDITIYEHDGRSILSLHLKLAPDVSIADAHAVAKLVEATLCREPGVEDVHTHLEPLEQPAVPPDMALADAHTSSPAGSRMTSAPRSRTCRTSSSTPSPDLSSERDAATQARASALRLRSAERPCVRPSTVRAVHELARRRPLADPARGGFEETRPTAGLLGELGGQFGKPTCVPPVWTA
jgi:hypothetical protein